MTTTIRALATSKHPPLIPVRRNFEVKLTLDELRVAAAPDLSHHRTFVADIIGNRVPIGRLTECAANDRESIARAYVQSLNQLNACIDDANAFFEALAASMIEQRGAYGETGWKEAVAKSRDALLTRISYRVEHSPSILSAELAILPPGQLLAELRADVQRHINLLAEHYFATLADAARRGLVGNIQWLDRATCRYSYFTAPIICEGESVKQKVTATEVRTKRTMTFQHRFGVHVHDLMSASMLHGLPPTLMMPARVERFARAIPWPLRPLLAVADGLLIHERIVEWDAFKSTIVEERVEIRPQVSVDPAICLGPYVLAGWSERDFESPSFGDTAVRRAARRWMKITQ